MKNHLFWMLLVCLAPIFLIFLLPSFGVTSDTTLFLFVVIFFIAHLFMMRGHSHGQINKPDDKKSNNSPTNKD